MKKYIYSAIIAGLLTLGVWVLNNEPQITQALTFGAFGDPFVSIQLATSPSSGYILSTDGTNNSWIANTGGGSGGGSWATTTITGSSNYFNYSLNATDVVGIGSTSGTSTSKFWFDPNLGTSWLNRASTTLFSANTGYFNWINATSTTATSTFSGAVQIGATTGDNDLKITADRVYPSSDSVGGMVNITNTSNSSQALNIYTNAGAVRTNDIFKIKNDNALNDQRSVFISHDGVANGVTIDCNTATRNVGGECFNLTDETGANRTAFGVSGAPIGLGLLKFTLNSGADASASALSMQIDDDDAQGIFADTITGYTGKLLNLRVDGNEKLTLNHTGLLTFGYSSSTIYSSFITASSTNLHLGTGQGFLYTGSNGVVRGIASSSINLSWFNNDSAFITDGNTNWDNSYGFTTFAYPFPSAATTTRLTLSGGLDFPYSSSTIYSSFIHASTTNLTFGGVTADTWPEFCTAITGGAGLCDGSDDGAGGGTEYDFTYNTSLGYGLTGSATSTKVKFTLGLLASTTNFFDYASTTQLSIGSDYVTDLDGTGLTLSSGALNVDTSQNIATLSNLTNNGLVTTSGSNGTLSVTTNGTNGTVLAMSAGIPTWVATTTFSGGLSYSAGNVTNTLTAGDGLTRTVDDIDCDTANGSTFGCLSSTDWTTFNSKLSSYDAWTHPASGKSATTSELWTTGGILSTASSTFNGAFRLPALSQGFSYVGSQGELKTIASSSINLSWFNNDSDFKTFAWPFTVNTGYNSTTTTLGFLNGFISTASSTLMGTTTITGNFANVRASTTASATQNINWSTGTFQDIFLTANTMIVINSTSSNPIDGMNFKIRFCQDGTGSRTITWATPAFVRWGGVNNATTTISSTANTCSMVGGTYISTNGNSNYFILASSTGMTIK